MAIECDRHWLLTTTTYGSWLPGDARGFVSNVRADGHGPEVRHNRVGEDYDRDMPWLQTHARASCQGEIIRLDYSHADILLRQFQETCGHRKWRMLATAIMRTHVHVVLGVPGDPRPETLLQDLKSYGSRALSKEFGKPGAPRWWTEGGSRRKLSTHLDVIAAVRYVLEQSAPLLIWTDAFPELNIAEAGIYRTLKHGHD
jgi:REP element-mobilizing transposase RayT